MPRLTEPLLSAHTLGSVRRALIIEDDPASVELIRDGLALQPGEIETLETDSLAAAIEILGKNRVDVALLDLKLVDADGAETVRRLLSRFPDLAIVVVTATNDDDVALDCIRHGAQDFLPKPELTPTRLHRAITHALQRHADRERLRRSKLNLRNIIEGSADGLVVLDESRTILHANAAAAELHTTTVPELLGRSLDFPAIEGTTTEVTLQPVDAAERTIEMRVTRIEWQDAPAYLGSLRDVTDRVRTAALERRLVHQDRLASIGQLAAGVAHEINNPLAWISSNLHMLTEVVNEVAASPTDTALLEECRQMIAESLEGTTRVATIVKNLKSFARSDSGEVQLTDVNEVVGMAAQMTNNEIKHRARLELELGELPLIAADRGRLGQLLVNLLVNACHALDLGHADINSIRIKTYAVDNEIFIDVIDSGHGIPTHLIDHIFDPFFTTKDVDGGTGLGLSLCVEIVADHNGQIGVTSREGEGTTFTVRLPHDTGLAVGPATGRFDRTPMAGGRVLVIDDEPLVRQAFERTLRRYHDVVLANGGAAGLARLIEDQAFDVILCDMMMPDLDGPSIFRQVAIAHPTLAARMIFVTAGTFGEDADRFLRECEQPILQKPVHPEALLAAIDGLMREHRSGAFLPV